MLDALVSTLLGLLIIAIVVLAHWVERSVSPAA